jgi:Tfp pilus assembly protein PilE
VRGHRRATRRGFTLIEAISTTVILGALGMVTSGLLLRASSAYSQSAATAQAQADLATAMERIDRALREIPLKAQSGAAPNITGVTATSVSWADASGSWSLSLSGTQLLLTAPGQSAQVLLNGVSAMSVQAFDQSNAAMSATLSGTACDSVRRLAVSVTSTASGRSETLRTKVFLRGAMSGGSGV